MPARTSTRQAAAKANQAFSHGAAGSKRKGSAAKGSLPKKGKKEEKAKEGTDYKKPSVTEEALETEPSESWTAEQATVNKQPTEPPPQKAEKSASDGAVKDEGEEAKQSTNGARTSPKRTACY